jgi:putative FmdB family regulatory protein
MPTYTFKCNECNLVREVIMSVSCFDDGGKNQECSHCGEPMKQQFHSPHVIYHGKGFHTTDYPKPLPRKNVPEMEKKLEADYYEQMVKSEDFHQAKEDVETVRINQFRNTKTGEKVHIPIDD